MMRKSGTLKRALGLLKDQASAGFAFATGPFSRIQYSVVMVTTHDEYPIDEKHMQALLSVGLGSRMRVSYCVTALLKRLAKTRNWAVALKCLVVFHRAVVEGGFMFQDQLTYLATHRGRDYLNLVSFKDDSSPLSWELSIWVRRYAKYLDERLICSRVIRSYFDTKSPTVSGKVCYMGNEELLQGTSQLLSLVKELCDCAPDGSARGNGLVLQALRSVVVDAFRIRAEFDVRIAELFERLTVLQLAEAIELLYICDRAKQQSERLVHFVKECRELRLPQALDFELPDKAVYPEAGILQLHMFIRSASGQKYLDKSSSLMDSGSAGFYSFRLPKRAVEKLRRTLSSTFSIDDPVCDDFGPRHLAELRADESFDLVHDANALPMPNVGHNEPTLISVSNLPILDANQMATSSSLLSGDAFDLIDLSDDPAPTKFHLDTAHWEQILMDSVSSLNVATKFNGSTPLCSFNLVMQNGD